jgi:hypothetical protein
MKFGRNQNFQRWRQCNDKLIRSQLWMRSFSSEEYKNDYSNYSREGGCCKNWRGQGMSGGRGMFEKEIHKCCKEQGEGKGRGGMGHCKCDDPSASEKHDHHTHAPREGHECKGEGHHHSDHFSSGANDGFTHGHSKGRGKGRGKRCSRHTETQKSANSQETIQQMKERLNQNNN